MSNNDQDAVTATLFTNTKIQRLTQHFDECIELLREFETESFVTMTATNKSGERFEITVRMVGGATPADKIEELKQMLEEATT